MRAALAKTVRAEFQNLMSQSFASFELLQAPEVVATGNPLYRARIGDGFYGFISLQFHRRTDAFTINVFVSSDENRGTPSEDPKSARESPILRIHETWGASGDYWFAAPGEKFDRSSIPKQKEPVNAEDIAEFEKLVAQAIQLIGEHVIPYFNSQVAQQK